MPPTGLHAAVEGGRDLAVVGGEGGPGAAHQGAGALQRLVQVPRGRLPLGPQRLEPLLRTSGPITAQRRDLPGELPSVVSICAAPAASCPATDCSCSGVTLISGAVTALSQRRGRSPS